MQSDRREANTAIVDNESTHRLKSKKSSLEQEDHNSHNNEDQSGIGRSFKESNDLFPHKLYRLLEDVDEGKSPIEEKVIQWRPHGKAFNISDKSKFVEEVMPRYFKHTSKFTSFQRQLNLYGFTRLYVGDEKGSYYHKHFVKGKPELCKQMMRTKINGKQVRQPRNDDEPKFDDIGYYDAYDDSKMDGVFPQSSSQLNTVESIVKGVSNYPAHAHSLVPVSPMCTNNNTRPTNNIQIEDHQDIHLEQQFTLAGSDQAKRRDYYTMEKGSAANSSKIGSITTPKKPPSKKKASPDSISRRNSQNNHGHEQSNIEGKHKKYKRRVKRKTKDVISIENTPTRRGYRSTPQHFTHDKRISRQNTDSLSENSDSPQTYNQQTWIQNHSVSFQYSDDDKFTDQQIQEIANDFTPHEMNDMFRCLFS